MKKKILALILAAVMCLGLLSVSASAASVGETHTVTFDVMWLLVPGDIVGNVPAPITVTNGDKWNLTKPMWFTAVIEIDWYTEDFERITNGDIINLDSDITIYACAVDRAENNRPTAAQKPTVTPNPVATSAPVTTETPTITSEYDKIAATASAWAQADVSEAFRAGLIPENRLAFTAGGLGFPISRVSFCELIAKLVEAKTGMDITAYAESLGKTVGGHFIDSYSYTSIEAAYSLGIVNGVSENRFEGGHTITRQEAAAMLERAAKVLGITSGGSGMSFSDGVANWATDSVSFVSGLVDPVSGSPIMSGVGNGCFDPTGKYTVEQAIVTVLRLYHCA